MPTLQDGLGIALLNINATNAQQQNPNGWHFQLGALQVWCNNADCLCCMQVANELSFKEITTFDADLCIITNFEPSFVFIYFNPRIKPPLNEYPVGFNIIQLYDLMHLVIKN